MTAIPGVPNYSPNTGTNHSQERHPSGLHLTSVVPVGKVCDQLVHIDQIHSFVLQLKKIYESKCPVPY